MMKKNLNFILVALAVIMSAAAMNVSASVTRSADDGALCRAANLQQAFELAWDHARVSNPGNRDLWVICPVNRNVDFVMDTGATNTYWRTGSVRVTAWYGADADAAAEVVCILRDMAYGVLDTAATNSVTNQFPQTASGLPQVVQKSFDTSGFTGPVGPTTLTCKLPPGTGINAIGQTATWVAP